MLGRESSYVGEHGFGLEEWNLNTADILNGKVFGYSRFNPSARRLKNLKKNDIYFYAINPAKERVLIGYYKDAAFLEERERDQLREHFAKSEVFKKRTEELLALNLPRLKTKTTVRRFLLGEFAANIAVDPENVFAVTPGISLTAQMLGGHNPKYLSRYTSPLTLPLFQTPDRSTKAKAEAQPATPPEDKWLLETAYLRFTPAQRKVIERLHNQLSNRLRTWLAGAGATHIFAESELVDLQCRFKGRRYLFELKTCFQQTTKHAIREAIGQLLEYGHFPGREPPDFPAIVLDQEPTPEEICWCKNIAAKGLPFELLWLKGPNVHSAKIFPGQTLFVETKPASHVA